MVSSAYLPVLIHRQCLSLDLSIILNLKLLALLRGQDLSHSGLCGMEDQHEEMRWVLLSDDKFASYRLRFLSIFNMGVRRTQQCLI